MEESPGYSIPPALPASHNPATPLIDSTMASTLNAWKFVVWQPGPALAPTLSSTHAPTPVGPSDHPASIGSRAQDGILGHSAEGVPCYGVLSSDLPRWWIKPYLTYQSEGSCRSRWGVRHEVVIQPFLYLSEPQSSVIYLKRRNVNLQLTLPLTTTYTKPKTDKVQPAITSTLIRGSFSISHLPAQLGASGARTPSRDEQTRPIQNKPS